MSFIGVSPARAAVVEASCPGPENSLVELSGDAREAQVFRTTHTGTVVGASIVIDKESSGGDFQVQILSAGLTTQLPINTVLGSATISDATVPIGTSTQTVSLNARVLRNRNYALVVTRPGGGLANLGERDNNPCPGREAFSPGQNAPWSAGDPDFDLVYQISLEPSNLFSVTSVLRRKITVRVPGPGTLVASEVRQRRRGGGKARPKLVKTSQLSTTGGPTGGSAVVILPMRLTRPGRLALKEKRRVKARVLVTYTPTDGQPNSIQVGVPLRVPKR
jgi:hypothetical protein